MGTFVAQAEQSRDARTVDVHIQKAYSEAGQGESHGNIGGHGALAHAAFAGHDHEFVFDAAHFLGQFVFLLFTLAPFSTRAGAAMFGHDVSSRMSVIEKNYSRWPSSFFQTSSSIFPVPAGSYSQMVCPLIWA